jgi:hypothetical protein
MGFPFDSWVILGRLDVIGSNRALGASGVPVALLFVTSSRLNIWDLFQTDEARDSLFILLTSILKC